MYHKLKGFSSTNEAYKYLIHSAKDEGITQNQIAKRMGISRQQITNNLRRKNLSIETVEALALELGSDVVISITK